MKSVINKAQVKKLIHENGLKSSRSFLDALDQFVAMQVVGAMRDCKNKKRIVLKREYVYFLIPVDGGEHGR